MDGLSVSQPRSQGTANEPGTPTREEVTAGGRRTAPTPHGRILALQGGEDVNNGTFYLRPLILDVEI